MQKAQGFFIVIFLGSFWMACEKSAETGAFNGRWIDLTYEYSEETIYWPTADGFQLEIVSAGMTEAGYYYAANNLCTAEHGGTHLDSPIHFAEGQWTTEQIPLDNLTGFAVVVDVSEKAVNNRDYLLSTEDFENWEKQNGKIPDDAIVLLRFGYGKYWPDRLGYLGTEMTGPEAVAELHFPGLDPEAAKWLVTERQIKAIGLDTPSIDFGQSKLFESHRILFEKNIPAFENVANLDQLPVQGAYIVALPMKIKGGSGAPLRIIAFLQDK